MEDRTTGAVRAQLAGMGAARFEVGILHAPTGKMLIRTWTVAEVEKAVPWLRRQNARGHDIYIRPEGSQGIVLVDDLTDGALGRMRRDGCAPAVVVETSPRNFQAWVRVAAAPIAPALATEVGRELATRYDGDMNSANWRHFGRLAGFTNQKPKHRRPDGRQPYVVLREATGALALEAQAVLRAAEERAEARAHADTQVRSLLHDARCMLGQHRAAFSAAGRDTVSELGHEYQQRMTRLLQRYPASDLSRLDWIVAKDLVRAHPEATQQALMWAMWEGSPRLGERKAGHADDYVLRTTLKVLRDPEVESAQKQVERHTVESGCRGGKGGREW